MSWKLLGGVALGLLFGVPVLTRLAGFFLNRRYAKRFPTDERFEFVPPDPTTDTIVFVHGLHGHFRDTWERMSKLLDQDPNLPLVDVLLWGYRATIFPGAHRLPKIGQALMSFVRDMTLPGTSLFFVGHSMGGLVILDGLSDEAENGRARRRPAGDTRYVVLYATPLTGSAVASAIASTVKWFPRLGYLLLNGHLRELTRGPYCGRLTRRVSEHLYDPAIQPAEADIKVRLPIKGCVGYRDEVVQESSAAFFRHHPPASYFETDTHVSVKEPTSRRDPRYKALHTPLAEHFDAWFRRRAQDIQRDDPAARIEVYMRCKHAALVRLCARPVPGRAADSDERVEELLRSAITLAMEPTQIGFGSALNMALVDMVRRGR